MIFTIIIFLVHFLPFFHSENTYMGIPFNVVDTNTYLSDMRQASTGKILFSNDFTSEVTPSIQFNPLWLMMGWLSIIFSPIFTWYTVKLIALILFFFSLNKIINLLKITQQGIAWILVLFGSGIGYVFQILHYGFGFKLFGSADVGIPSSNSISLHLAPVHFAISVSLMILIVYYYYSFWKNKNWKTFLIFSSLTFVLGFIHLFDVITLAVAFFLYSLLLLKQGRKIKDLILYNVIYGLFNIPPFLYTFYIFVINTTYANWNSQNLLLSPKLLHLFFGFLIPMLLAISFISFKKVFLKKDLSNIEILLVCWSVSSILLMYSPFNIQRRFIEGLNIPIMILAALGLDLIKETAIKIKIPNIVTYFFVTVFVILAIPTSIYWAGKVYINVDKIYDGDYFVPAYLSQDEMKVLDWISTNVSDSNILASYTLSNYIPRISDNRVYIGHWAQTVNFEEKKDIVNDFYSTLNFELLTNTGVEYIILEENTSNMPIMTKQGRFYVYKMI